MSKVQLIETGVLDDDKSYSIQIGFFFTPTGGDSDPKLQICDSSYCVGFEYWNPDGVAATGGTNLASECAIETHRTFGPQTSSTNWNIRIEIHPNSTSGITFVGTYSGTDEYDKKLEPSQGLHFKVCRHDTYEVFRFHLFELAVHLNV